VFTSSASEAGEGRLVTFGRMSPNENAALASLIRVCMTVQPHSSHTTG
jgi:hypothetical protein